MVAFTLQLGDIPIPAGTELVANIRGLHRDTRYWQESERFNPERFSPEHSQQRHKHAYMPFLIGPRKCIGDNFAMMEMQLVVPTILQQWWMRSAGAPPQEKTGFIMEPVGEVPMRVIRG